MSNQNYHGKGGQRGSGSGGVDAMAEQYVPAIQKMLLFENASTDDIKIGVEMIERLVKNNANVSAHQIRNVFTLIKDLKETTAAGRLSELHMLRPKLAYIGARQREIDGKIIIKVLDDIIKSIDLKEGEIKVINKINGLYYIMESIVAYHKFHSKNN